MDAAAQETRCDQPSGEVPQTHALILEWMGGICSASRGIQANLQRAFAVSVYRPKHVNTQLDYVVLEAQLHHRVLRVLSRLWNIRDRYSAVRVHEAYLMLLPVDAAAIISHNVRYRTSTRSLCLETQHARLTARVCALPVGFGIIFTQNSLALSVLSPTINKRPISLSLARRKEKKYPNRRKFGEQGLLRMAPAGGAKPA